VLTFEPCTVLTQPLKGFENVPMQNQTCTGTERSYCHAAC
jgi:hypothetical protein